ncbi:hypothetical protein ACFE04_009211 [Oxalis oulophora]
MGDWQPFLQSIIIGVLFSYLLAKLISVVVSFKDDNLKLTRDLNEHHQQQPPTTQQQQQQQQQQHGGGGESSSSLSRPYDMDSIIGEVGSVRNDDSVLNSSEDDDNDIDDDDDWEGVESTELDETQAWQKLGAMPPEDAMIKYLDAVTEIFPTWASGAAAKRKGASGSGGTDSNGPMGPVFSSFVYEEESGNELKMDAIHAFAREGEVNNLLKCVEKGAAVNSKDGEGRTPLHWAVDRGHLDVVQALVSNNADVNAKDDEGQTPLHYAVVCDRESIAEFLVKQNADLDAKDNDGHAPRGLCESNWSWLGTPLKKND